MNRRNNRTPRPVGTSLEPAARPGRPGAPVQRTITPENRRLAAGVYGRIGQRVGQPVPDDIRIIAEGR